MLKGVGSVVVKLLTRPFGSDGMITPRRFVMRWCCVYFGLGSASVGRTLSVADVAISPEAARIRIIFTLMPVTPVLFWAKCRSNRG